MKFLITALFICSSLQAATLGQYYSSPEGTSVQKFIVTDSKVILEKRSNFFDKKMDLRLGVFESTSTNVTKADKKKLEALYNKVKTVDKFMKKKNESFNSLSTKNPHASFFMLEEFRISQESDLYPEVKAIHEHLTAQEWKQKNGIKLTDDFKNVIHVKDGKETSREVFNFPFHCQKAEPPTVCGYREEGILYVK